MSGPPQIELDRHEWRLKGAKRIAPKEPVDNQWRPVHPDDLAGTVQMHSPVGGGAMTSVALIFVLICAPVINGAVRAIITPPIHYLFTDLLRLEVSAVPAETASAPAAAATIAGASTALPPRQPARR
jgi:hypothetical protein